MERCWIQSTECDRPEVHLNQQCQTLLAHKEAMIDVYYKIKLRSVYGYTLTILPYNVRGLCPSPTVPNLLQNEDEWTIRVGSIDHSRSFLLIRAMTMTMTIDLNSVLLMRVASAGQYEVFEHVQNVRVPSTNNLHSCLCALRTCSYRAVF